MIPHDAFNVHHKLLNMYDIEGRTAAVTQLWKGFLGAWGKDSDFRLFFFKIGRNQRFCGKNLFLPPSITAVYKGFQTSQIPQFGYVVTIKCS